MRYRVLYPGSFDPPTNGHLDIITRAIKLFGTLTVLVAETSEKSPLFSVDERVHLIRVATRKIKGVSVEPSSGLLVDFARKHRSRILIRGLRAVSDFDYEFAAAAMNRSLYSGLETVFLMTAEHLHYVSSRLVKEVAKFGGDCSKHVPPAVASALKKKLRL